MKILRLGHWSAFTLGLLTGLSLMQGVTAQERMRTTSALEKWHMEANYWKKEASQLKNELGAINRKSETQLYIQDIAVQIVKSPVPKDQVIEAMAPYTQALLGLSLQYLKLPVIYHLFNNRIIVIGTRLYQIRVHALLLGPHTELIISVSPDPSAQSL